MKQLETKHHLQENHQESNHEAALCMCCTLKTEHELWDILPNFCPNTQPEREKHNQTLFTGQLKYSVLSLNTCDTGKKSQKKPESCNSEERTSWCERRQKQETCQTYTGTRNWPFLSSQDHIKTGLKGTYSPYSKLLNAKRKLRGKKMPVVP